MPYIPKDPLLWRIMSRVPGPIGCLVILAWLALFIPVFPFWILHRRYLRGRFVKALATSDRLLPWPDFLTRTQKGNGSVIVEVGNKAQTRFWWTADRILSIAPMAPPRFGELNIIAYGGADFHPFARWCYEHYLSPASGNALLAYPVKAEFETFPFEEDYDDQMKKRFPDQDVVVLTFYDARYT